MKLCIKVLSAIMSMIYFVLKCLPTREKIVFLSRQHDTSNVDFDLMIDYIEEAYPNYECKVLARRIKSGIFHKIGYGFHTLHQMYELATSKIAILDTYCIPVSMLNHKEELVVIQIWHAIGAFKKFGLSIVGQEEGSSEKIAEYMQMHRNYDYVCASSEFCKPFFAEAFGVTEDKVVAYPLPRLDKIMSDEVKRITLEKIYKRYPEFLSPGKKTVLYAPTFRKSKCDVSEAVLELVTTFDFRKYNLVIKPHPLSTICLEDRRVILDSEFDTSEIMLAADYLITDYSAIAFEGAVAQKPILFFATDYEAYMKKRDFYTEYETTIPGTFLRSGHAVMMAIENNLFDREKTEKFKEKYVKDSEKSYTIDLVEFIMNTVK